MVGMNPPRALDIEHFHQASGNALMSLLREGGQWDVIDDYRAGAMSTPANQPHDDQRPKQWSYGAQSGGEARGEKWGDEENSDSRLGLPSMVSYDPVYGPKRGRC